MQILIRQASIVWPGATLHGQQQDILIDHGTITAIGPALDAPHAKVISSQGLHVSPGWADVFAHFSDPGEEHKEDLQSGARAAAKGGFTSVMVVPNTNPALQTKPQIEYVLSRTRGAAAQVLPIGAVSKNLEGASLAEMYEMQHAGAVAFSDGLKPIQSSGILLKALQYVKAFNGIVIQVPDDKSISAHGLMHEGIFSTQLGMPGKPAIAEEIMVQRDLELAKYTGSRLHLTGVSTRKSLELITAAKAQGIQVTCSVTPYHLSLTDGALWHYNTNLKVNPPLRTQDDVDALREAVQSGLVDCIATHHLPQDWDAKEVEFEYAKNGMIGLESAFGVLRKHLPHLPLEQLVALLSTRPRQLFGLEMPQLEVGAKANLTLFQPDVEWTFTEQDIASRSKNSAYLGAALQGKVLGVINGSVSNL
ncbi:dihydroorotase [Chitinophaga parva]|uniref:Dihydroorotase n=1 Tax=Chitinophaga parva TaxID=2169414 RepID=A0A2T7BIF1_9BACT|nr:dihydroorotase [Chitinophaga parva]PUZ26048.1 dihydroorotase [Chitinophaga parva]